jgi:hypothetical protein
MIEVRITQKEVIDHIKENCVEQELSDFIMELTFFSSQDFSCALIKRLCARENIRNGKKKRDASSTMETYIRE